MKGHGSGSVTRYITKPFSMAFNTALYFELSVTRLYKLSRRDLGAQLSQLCYPKHKSPLGMTFHFSQTFQTDVIKILNIL